MKMIPYNVHYEIGASLLMILLLCCIVGKKRLQCTYTTFMQCVRWQYFLSVDRSIRTVFLEFGVSDELS